MDKAMIANIRHFNRRYTNMIGVLNSHVLDSGYSFTEARVMVEIGMNEPCIANMLVDSLNIDRSYMSRIIRRLVKLGLLYKQSSADDQRISLLRLTDAGKALYKQLDDRSNEQINRLFCALPPDELNELHAAMQKIEQKLDQLERTHDDTI
ncbi:MarR family winged helix-turn-helix transcriptional regulator [Paenibacillus campi]|uniref:MarR family winged helix-turn-helix transcriptional regulator n=1 Tax=Paenibacillus campi TaxID=3106031 RepID=UPI002AFEB586|nr:MarR family transcriptional regulator [Paenibacillus sp. SGZ-1014]